MKRSFKEIREEWNTKFRSPTGNDVTVYINPTRKELSQLARTYHDSVAAILYKDNLYVWTNGLHYHVKEHYRMGNEFVSMMLYITHGMIAGVGVTDTTKTTKWHENPKTREYIFNHKRIKRNLTPDADIYYYNQDVVGAWHEMELAEEYFNYINFNASQYDILKNPTPVEIGKRKWKYLGIIITKYGDAIVFNGYDLLHSQVEKLLSGEGGGRAYLRCGWVAGFTQDLVFSEDYDDKEKQDAMYFMDKSKWLNRYSFLSDLDIEDM